MTSTQGTLSVGPSARPYLNGSINGDICNADESVQEQCRRKIATLMQDHRVNRVDLYTLRYVKCGDRAPVPGKDTSMFEDRLGGTVEGCRWVGFTQEPENDCSRHGSPFRLAMVGIMKHYGLHSVRLWWGGIPVDAGS